MSYENPFRESLKEDRAREHWESHVLDNSKEAKERRTRKAIEALGQRNPSAEAVNEERRRQEEAAFQAWLADKRATGFAWFSPY